MALSEIIRNFHTMSIEDMADHVPMDRDDLVGLVYLVFTLAEEGVPFAHMAAMLCWGSENAGNCRNVLDGIAKREKETP